MAEIEKNYKLFVLSLYGDSSLDRKRAAFVSSSTSTIILDLLHTVGATAESLIAAERREEIADFLATISKKFMTKKIVMSLQIPNTSYTIDEGVVVIVHNRTLTLAAKKQLLRLA